MMEEKIVFIVGATASGKTAIAAALAKKIGGEVISCDSMQIYKGMDIITSKPTQKLLKSVPHHLISRISPAKDYDVSRYSRAAVRSAKDILRRGKVPVFAGGTGLYMTVLLDGIFRQKAGDPKARNSLCRLAGKKGRAYLYNRLSKTDPEAAARIHPNDLKRVIRALEVQKVTGEPISMLQKKRRGLYGRYDVRVFCLDPDRQTLYRRIEERVDRMFAKGLVPEARKLLRSKLGRTASFAIGLRELKSHFDGVYGLEEARRLIKTNTRRYAKRQLSWFRKDKRIKWIKIPDNGSSREVVRKIWKECF